MRPPILAFSVLLLLGGCYSYGLRKPEAPPVDAFGPVQANGQICVLRPHWLASAVTAAVHDNGQLVGATRGPTYFCYLAQPGHHVITSKADSLEQATLEVEAGQRYYLHQIVDNIVGFVRTRLAWVTESEAQELVPKCGYRVLVSVPGNERLPSEAPVPANVVATGG
jgi:hypothetical protein